MSDTPKYPKPLTEPAPITPDFDGYRYATVFGWSIVRHRLSGRWCVRRPSGETVATSAHWQIAMANALEQR